MYPSLCLGNQARIDQISLQDLHGHWSDPSAEGANPVRDMGASLVSKMVLRFVNGEPVQYYRSSNTPFPSCKRTPCLEFCALFIFLDSFGEVSFVTYLFPIPALRPGENS